MAKYKVNHNYTCVTVLDGSTLRLGPWEAGSEVDIDDDRVVEFVNSDSPGCITEAAAKRAVKKAPKDRMARGSKSRSKKDADE
tara:strand:- start:1 stop:249 length:249 start_codon:yes stop_codon:yes gene_type:complete